MKLNIDCIRDILLTIEDNQQYGELWTISQLQQYLPNYSDEDLQYTCLKLHEAGYIDTITFQSLGMALPEIGHIKGLTFAGHELLETIRPKTVYDKTKSFAKSLGTQSISAIMQIASSVLSETISSHFYK